MSAADFQAVWDALTKPCPSCDLRDLTQACICYGVPFPALERIESEYGRLVGEVERLRKASTSPKVAP